MYKAVLIFCFVFILSSSVQATRYDTGEAGVTILTPASSQQASGATVMVNTIKSSTTTPTECEKQGTCGSTTPSTTDVASGTSTSSAATARFASEDDSSVDKAVEETEKVVNFPEDKAPEDPSARDAGASSSSSSSTSSSPPPSKPALLQLFSRLSNKESMNTQNKFRGRLQLQAREAFDDSDETVLLGINFVDQTASDVALPAANAAVSSGNDSDRQAGSASDVILADADDTLDTDSTA